MKAVAYLRVSSREQGKSGLGLEAQKAAIEAFCKADGQLHIVDWFTEVESGKRVSDTLSKRPQLAAALNRASQLRGPVVVSKLDRLSRSVSFIADLLDNRVDFVVCQFGKMAHFSSTNKFIMHMFAAFAEMERDMIGERTSAALQALKARGMKLGTPKPGNGGKASAVRRRAEAEAAYRVLDPPALAAMGGGTLAERAERLNAAGYRTSRGKLFGPTSVLRILRRAALPGRP